jgi:DNA-binding transcriptional LysR family regulator
MKTRGPYRIPPANALIAFESAARHGNFTLAARELRTSQSAVSRQVSKLETWLSARLFERSRAGATLTAAGERFRDGVAAGLAAIHRGAAEAAELSNAEQVVIACSHETSHFLIMPRYDALRRALGEDVRIRILTYHHYIQSLPADPSADIRLTWDAAGSAPEDRVVAFREAVRPVCSPAYAAEHPQTLAGPVAGWSGLTFLDLLRPNEGWASWEDWFAVAGRPDRAPRRLGLDSYTYVLEAAAAGHGIALGWRHLVKRSLEAGALVALGDGFVEFDRTHYGVLTEKGRRKPLARRCLAFFKQIRTASASATRPRTP